jgi:RNA polymerase sigma factor (sigma-70 family)
LLTPAIRSHTLRGGAARVHVGVQRPRFEVWAPVPCSANAPHRRPVAPPRCGRVRECRTVYRVAGQRPQQDDSELLRRCIAGEASAWNALIERYRLLVYAVPTRHGLMPDECDDVFQTVFLALLRNVSLLRDHQALAKWLIVTASRESVRVRSGRSPAARSRSNPPGPRPSPSDPPPAELERLERHQRIWIAIERLEPGCRDLLTALFNGPGRADYAAVSRQLGIPIGSIGPGRARCLARLVELLRE